MKRKTLLLLLLLQSATLFAGQGEWKDFKHELSLGVGDMMFETAIWHNQAHRNYSGVTAEETMFENRNYSYTPHIFAEYLYSPLRWFSIGMTCDFQSTVWDKYFYNSNNLAVSSSHENFFNLCIMPTFRFSYINRDAVRLYTTIAVGMDINGGSETDCFGKHTLAGFAADLRLIGVSAGGKRFRGFLDLGGMVALKDTNTIFMLGSQIVRVGVTYRFNTEK